MSPTSAPPAVDAVVIEPSALDALVLILERRGHRVLGPTVRDHAIVLGELASAADLPIGWGDEQTPGRYRLHQRHDQQRFAYAVGPSSPRRELSPPSATLVTIRRTTDDQGRPSFDAEAHDHTQAQPLAFFGLRPCEVAAMAIHERVLVGGAHPDPVQLARGTGRFVVAVDCGHPAATCFCTSMGTGPAASLDGVDLRLCELWDDTETDRHRFLCWPGSEAGAEVLAELAAELERELVAASASDLAAADAVVTTAASRIQRHLPTEGLAERLAAVPEHPRWDDVADRCLSCTNCTLVCPTCFCSTVHDLVDLDGSTTERTRVWDSCFTVDHSYLHGGSVHASIRSRYRQWLTHKLGTWWDQFGESGCVGCGRCIAWCPAGIDLVAEANALLHDRPTAPTS